MMMKMNPQRKRNDLPTGPMQLRPANARRRSVAATERQIFQISLCAWDLLTEWKKVTHQTSTHMQTVVFVGRRFRYSMILTGR
jgi:hypothetical protein